jgi:hypothetical protein
VWVPSTATCSDGLFPTLREMMGEMELEVKDAEAKK